MRLSMARCHREENLPDMGKLLCTRDSLVAGLKFLARDSLDGGHEIHKIVK